MKQIVKVPHHVLTTPAAPVKNFDKKLLQLVNEMKSTLQTTRNPKGVGLAATQIGEPYRLFIIRPHEKDPIRVFINPEIVEKSENATDGVPERDQKLEGCLSIPKIWGKVARAKKITLTYQDETGEKHTEVFSGFPATIIQHETDHINGILFTYRVLEQKGQFYQTGKDENGKEVLDAIELK